VAVIRASGRGCGELDAKRPHWVASLVFKEMESGAEDNRVIVGGKAENRRLS
jgi:hypothetical protein